MISSSKSGYRMPILRHHHPTLIKLLRVFLVCSCLLLLSVPILPVGARAGRGSQAFLIQNVGQFSSPARFVLKSGQTSFWLAEDHFWISHSTSQQSGPAGTEKGDRLQIANLRLNFVGANPHPRIQTAGRNPALVNYWFGDQAYSAPTFSTVTYHGLYPGVDLVINASQLSQTAGFVWHLETHPGADLSQVRLSVEGADSITLDDHQIHLETAVGQIRIPLIEVPQREFSNDLAKSPRLLDSGNGEFEIKTPLTEINRFAFTVLQDNPADLGYSSFLGGSDWDAGHAIKLGPDGSIFVAGRTVSTDFPTTTGVFDSRVSQIDAFVAKMDADGERLVYAVVLGGSGFDAAYGLALLGDLAYVTGETRSVDFPTSATAFDDTCGSDGDCDPAGEGPFSDAFLALINEDGSRLSYSTYLGGQAEDSGYDVAVDDQQVFLTGITHSPDFPAEGYQGGGDAFVVSFDNTRSLVYATLLGGRDVDAGFGIAVRQGQASITGESFSSDFPGAGFSGGRDVLIASLDPSGDVQSAQLLGGLGEERGNTIAVDGSGNRLVGGWTTSADFPANAGAYAGAGDGFILLMDAQDDVTFAAYFGGTGADEVRGVAFGDTGNLYMAGWTTSQDFPITSDAYQTSQAGGSDAFVVNINPAADPDAQLLYSSYLGGNGEDSAQGLAFLEPDQAYLTGYTQSDNFPVTANAFASDLSGFQDAFIARLSVDGSPRPIPTVATLAPTSTSVPTTPVPTQDSGTETASTPEATDSLDPNATSTVSAGDQVPGETPTTSSSAPDEIPADASETEQVAEADTLSSETQTSQAAVVPETEVVTADQTPSQPTSEDSTRQAINWLWILPVLLLAALVVMYFIYKRRSSG
jgi:hypothetical protein